MLAIEKAFDLMSDDMVELPTAKETMKNRNRFLSWKML